MEPRDEIPALQVRPSEVGIIKEAPVRRWYAGQEAVDRKYEKSARRILKRRRKIEERVEQMLQEAREEGLMLINDQPEEQQHTSTQGKADASTQPQPKDEAPAEHQDGDAPGPSKLKRKKIVRVASAQSGLSAHTDSSSVRIDEYRRYGPLDLEGERPPPTAIAGRRDTVCATLELPAIELDY